MNPVVVVPYYDKLDFEHIQSINALGLPVLSLHGCASLDLARSYAVTRALEDPRNFDTFLLLDSDIIFPKEAADILFEDISGGFTVVAGAYTIKQPLGPILSVPLNVITYGTESGLFQAAQITMGFTAISRKVFENLYEECPMVKGLQGKPTRMFFMPKIWDGCYFTEDFAFCLRLKQHGIIPYIDGRARVWHKGYYHYGIEDSNSIIKRISFSGDP